MKITYDPEVDAVYIQLVDKVSPGQASEQIHSILTHGGKGEVTLDFDANGKMLGIEILNAKEVLPESAIHSATTITNS